MAKLCLTSLKFIDKVRNKDFSGAVLLLKDSTFKVAGAKIPTWDTKSKRIVERPVHILAGLLCYTDPVEQTKDLEIGELFSEQTRRVLVDTIVISTDMQKDRAGKVRLS